MGTYRVIDIVRAEPRALESPSTPMILFSVLVGSAMVYWAANEETDRINKKLLSLLEKATIGRWSGDDAKTIAADVREIVETPYLSDQAKRVVTSVASAFKPMIPGAEMFRVQQTPVLPTEIMGVPVGTRSEVSREIPPVGATLPATDVLEGYLGGERRSELSAEEGKTVETYNPDPADISTMHRVITQLTEDIAETRPDLKYGGNIVTDVGLSQWNLEALAKEYGEKRGLDTIDAMAELKRTGLMDEPLLYDNIYNETVREQLTEHVYEYYDEYLMPYETNTITSPTGINYEYKMLLESAYGGYTTAWNLYITNKSTLRSYIVPNLDDMIVGYFKEGVIVESDIKPTNAYLVDPIAAQSKIDREMAVAASQFINWAESPGLEASLQREHEEAERICTAWNCYAVQRSIMDQMLAINKAGCDSEGLEFTPDMTECDYVEGDQFMDYCCEFREMVERAAEKKLEGRTWTRGSPWLVDVCGVHVEVEGEWYTIPPDNVLEYKWNSDPTPKYLEGLVCAAFAVVTPETQREMEAKIVERRDVLEKAEPWVILGALLNLYREQNQNTVADFVERAHEGTVVEAFKHVMEQRWLDLHSFRVDVNVSGVNYNVGTRYNKEVDALSVTWTEGQEIDRGEYVVDGPTFARYLYDVAQGRPRNSVTFRSL